MRVEIGAVAGVIRNRLARPPLSHLVLEAQANDPAGTISHGVLPSPSAAVVLLATVGHKWPDGIGESPYDPRRGTTDCPRRKRLLGQRLGRHVAPWMNSQPGFGLDRSRLALERHRRFPVLAPLLLKREVVVTGVVRHQAPRLERTKACRCAAASMHVAAQRRERRVSTLDEALDTFAKVVAPKRHLHVGVGVGR